MNALKALLVSFVLFCFFLPPSLFALDPAKLGFPDTWSKIGVFVDQLPSNMTPAQIKFAATHYAGSQKLTLDISSKLRRYNRKFVVLHYHLGIWQQQPAHTFIIDGRHWGNDWDYVTRHEDWFWHNEKGERVRSKADGKYLMNISNEAFREYWKKSIYLQMKKGKYQGVFLDSASVDLLQGEAGQADPRLAKTAAKFKRFQELDGKTWSEAYEDFMLDLTRYLESREKVTIPNITGRFTTWDTTDYYTTASGAFGEGAFDTTNTADWRLGMKRFLRLTSKGKIVIFQPYLRSGINDIKKRMYFLSCYLLLKDRFTYINYFSGTTLSWFPEYEIDLGRPIKRIHSIRDIEAKDGLFRRAYEKGEVIVNPTSNSVTIDLRKKMYKVIPEGGGPVPKDGRVKGRLHYEKAEKLKLGPWEGVVLLVAVP